MNSTRIKRAKIGDIFATMPNNGFRRFFQYVADDETQLNSQVIRAFKREYELGDNLDLPELVEEDVDFFAHVVIKLGIQLNLWERVGNCQKVGKVDAYFKASDDIGDPSVKVSKRWWVWKVNDERRFVGPLTEPYEDAEVGSVINPNSIVNRMWTGKYDFVYPGHK